MRGSKKSKSLAEKLGGFFTNLFLILSVVFCTVVALGVLQSKVPALHFPFLDIDRYMHSAGRWNRRL